MIRSKGIFKIYFCNYYKILNVSQDAQINEIKQKFIQLAKKHHPDTSEVQSQQFSKIKTAYDTLRDPDLRKQYDYQLIHGSPTSKQRSYHYYYKQQQDDDPYARKANLINGLIRIGFMICLGYLASIYLAPMTWHQIRRQNVILSRQNYDSNLSVQQKRRKIFMKQMQQKKVSSNVIEIKCSNSAEETTKRKNTRKNSIQSIHGVSKQKTLEKFVPKQSYM